MVSKEGLKSLYDQAVFCERVALGGDFVECGVWKGGSVGVMALANLKHGRSRRTLHLFDAFDDICEPDAAVDGERAITEVHRWTNGGGTQGRLVPLKGIYDQFGGHGTIDECRTLLERIIGYDGSQIHYHQGWFQETLPSQASAIKNIAILRLDGDWYASTKVSLDYLFEKVVPGGFVVIDDYGSYDGCRKAVDEFLARLEQPLFLNVVNSQIRYLITTSANPWKTVVREMVFAGATGGADAAKGESCP
jgi:hypothetical protein